MPFHVRFHSGGAADAPGGDGTQASRPKKPRKALGSAFARVLVNLLVTLIFGGIYFYLKLPALNFHSEEFYLFVFLLCAVYCVCAVFTSGFQGEGAGGYFRFVKKQCAVPFFLVIAMIAVVRIVITEALPVIATQPTDSP